MKELNFNFVVAGGKVPPVVAGEISEALRALDGKVARITMKEIKPLRSLRQNAYYWSVVVRGIRDMMRDYGNDVDNDNVHDFLKVHIGKLEKNITLPDGTEKTIPGSTAEEQTKDFEDYLEKCRAFAAENGVIIPLPNEHLYPPTEGNTYDDGYTKTE